MSRDFSGDEGTNKRGTTTTTTTTTSGRFEGTVIENIIYVHPNTQFNNKVPSKKEKQKDDDN